MPAFPALGVTTFAVLITASKSILSPALSTTASVIAAVVLMFAVFGERRDRR
jgi:hypothetical protein